MRKFFAVLVLMVLVMQAAAKLTVAVSVQPYANLVKEIGGNDVEVVTLLPPGADPHTFEPKPATLKEFAKATVYFSDGTGMDKAWLPRFKGVNQNVQVFSLSKGVSLMEGNECHHHGEEHHHDDEDEMDPHLWTSPKQMLLVAENVLEALKSLEPSKAEALTARAASLKNRLMALDQELRSAVSKLPENGKTFIVFHPSYGYFARDYGMKQLTIEVEGKEPKPRDLMNLVKVGKEHNVHIVFVQPQFSKRAAASIAKELSATVLNTDPLAYDYEKNVRELISVMSSGR